MKRRLSLACAFIGDPKIVLLDEVTETLFLRTERDDFLLAVEWSRSLQSSSPLGLAAIDEGRQDSSLDHPFHGGE